MLLTLTWCDHTPADTPTSPCNSPISGEHQVDNITPACEGSWQGGANILASDNNSAIVATALLHQGCPVAVRDCQVVQTTGGIILDVESSEC